MITSTLLLTPLFKIFGGLLTDQMNWPANNKGRRAGSGAKLATLSLTSLLVLRGLRPSLAFGHVSDSLRLRLRLTVVQLLVPALPSAAGASVGASPTSLRSVSWGGAPPCLARLDHGSLEPKMATVAVSVGLPRGECFGGRGL